MTPIKFAGYGVGAEDKTIIAERVTHWAQISYNGNYGTRIYLDTGNEVYVGEWPHEVEKKIKAASAGGVHVNANALRWALISERFDHAKLSRSERFLEAIGLDPEDANKPLSEIVDEALASEGVHFTGHKMLEGGV